MKSAASPTAAIMLAAQANPTACRTNAKTTSQISACVLTEEGMGAGPGDWLTGKLLQHEDNINLRVI